MVLRLALVLLLLAAPAAAADMRTYLRETQDMVSRGEYSEALERYVWFHNHALEREPGMYGVRLSFALSYWKELADVYPPALEALVRMRDAKRQKVLDKPGDFALVHDVVSLNDTLEQDDQSIQLFEELRTVAPEFAAKCWPLVKDAVIAAKRYDLAREFQGNPLTEFAKIQGMYLLTTSLYDREEVDRAEFAKHNEENFVNQCLKLIETTLALDDPASAKEIQAKALAVLDDQRLRAAIPAE